LCSFYFLDSSYDSSYDLWLSANIIIICILANEMVRIEKEKELLQKKRRKKVCQSWANKKKKIWKIAI
jgi:hypothetical protein